MPVVVPQNTIRPSSDSDRIDASNNAGPTWSTTRSTPRPPVISRTDSATSRRAVVVDRVRASEVERLGHLLRTARGADHRGSGGDGELHDRGRHARAGGVDEHRLTGLHPTGRDERVPRRHVGDRHARRLDEGHPGGDGMTSIGGGGHEFGEATLAGRTDRAQVLAVRLEPGGASFADTARAHRIDEYGGSDRRAPSPTPGTREPRPRPPHPSQRRAATRSPARAEPPVATDRVGSGHRPEPQSRPHHRWAPAQRDLRRPRPPGRRNLAEPVLAPGDVACSNRPDQAGQITRPSSPNRATAMSASYGIVSSGAPSGHTPAST